MSGNGCLLHGGLFFVLRQIHMSKHSSAFLPLLCPRVLHLRTVGWREVAIRECHVLGLDTRSSFHLYSNNCRNRKAFCTFLNCIPRSLQYSFDSNGCLIWLVDYNIDNTILTVAAETMPWDAFSFILEHHSTGRTEFGTFSTASGNVLGGADCPFLCLEKAS